MTATFVLALVGTVLGAIGTVLHAFGRKYPKAETVAKDVDAVAQVLPRA